MKLLDVYVENIMKEKLWCKEKFCENVLWSIYGILMME